jgi:FdhD protein
MIAVSDRPRVGISACLLGERVRYDGGDKRDAWLVEELGPQVEWVPVCPEVEAGFGTPRPPMNLGGSVDRGLVLVTDRVRDDLTETLRHYSVRRVEELAADLDGYVLKAGSPSCGLDVPVYTIEAEGTVASGERGRGLFAEALTSRLRDLPIADERQLADPSAREAFVARLFEHFDRRTRARPNTESHCAVDVVRVRGGARSIDRDRAASEEPLEIRLHDRPFVVIMRTPGADRELAAGFLLAERVIRAADDLGTIAHCTAARGAAGQNIVNVTLANGGSASIEQLMADRRQTTTSSSCGLCGRRTIDSLTADVPPLSVSWTIDASRISAMPPALRARQSVFDETGGLHAAGLFDRTGALIEVAEDVGRHNAVDKVVGRMLIREALPLSRHALCVSGRTSFEIVQKALFAGIPIVVAVSAPSTLAIDLAEASGVTLIGFVRGDAFNIYAHAERVVVSPPGSS